MSGAVGRKSEARRTTRQFFILVAWASMIIIAQAVAGGCKTALVGNIFVNVSGFTHQARATMNVDIKRILIIRS